MYSWCATLGPIGYLLAPDSLATLATIPVVFWLQTLLGNQWEYFFFWLALFVVGLHIVTYSAHEFKRVDDAAEIVLDEFLACIFLFWGVPLTTVSVITGFILFRFFDSFTITTIRRHKNLVNAWEIMFDDLIAAMIVNLILRFMFIQ